MAREVVVTAKQIKKRKKLNKIVKITILCCLLLLILTFIILSVVYNGGRFTVTLDPNFALETGIVIYENKEYPDKKGQLYAENIDFMDNISVNWIPKDIHNEKDGSHNGNNYIAYTFYVANEGDEVQNYWYSIQIDDVIKNVDEAVRVMIYRNDEKTIYAKTNSYTSQAEKDTEPFFSKDIAVLKEVKNFKPKDVDKFTIVIWLEGDDPDCIDALIGGEIKMHMDIREEHIDPSKQALEDKESDANEQKQE